MANAIYDKGREAFLSGAINWGIGTGGDDIRVILVDVADYTVNLSADNFLDDVPVAARVSTSTALTGKSVTDGVADADNVILTSVTGDPAEALVIYKHTGTESTSNLIAYIDTATGLGVTPNGGNITITWDDGANKIFKL